MIRQTVMAVALGVGLAAACSTAGAQAASWTSTRPLWISGYVPVFVAATPRGDLVVTTFNSRNRPGLLDLPIVVIENPLGPGTRYLVLARAPFDSMRGYSGVAVDGEGNIYVAADTGRSDDSWIRKYRPDGTADAAFGQGGEVRTGKRMLGMAVLGNHVLSTGAFAELMVFDKETGRLAGSAPTPAPAPVIRDIAVDEASGKIYGVAEGGVWVWEGGTPATPGSYRLRQISPGNGGPRAGEGIGFLSTETAALVVDPRTGELVMVTPAGQTSRIKVTDETANFDSLADAAMLPGGGAVVVTDMAHNSLHVLRNGAIVQSATTPAPTVPALTPLPTLPVTGDAVLPPPLSAVATPAVVAPVAAAVPAVADAGGVPWVRSFASAEAQARSEGKNLLVYARAEGVAQCTELEQGLLRSPEFAAVAANFVPCFLDVETDRATAQRLGYFKVPVISLISPTGQTMTSLMGQFGADEVMARLSSATGGQ